MRNSGPMHAQNVVVTGASRGIGAAIARSMARLGANVLMVSRSIEPLQELAGSLAEFGGTFVSVSADVASTNDLDDVVARAAKEFGRVDLLVNNAGVLPPAARHERTSLQDWDQVHAVNVRSVWYLSTRLYPLMSERGGLIVNMASTAAHYPSIGLGPYCVSKSSLLMLTRSLALEWARVGIRVVSISPGKINTDMVAPIVEWAERNDAELNLMHRVGAPEELAELVTFLASPHGSYMTGCDIAFDGGEMTTVP